jgi:hypothetical protein
MLYELDATSPLPPQSPGLRELVDTLLKLQAQMREAKEARQPIGAALVAQHEGVLDSIEMQLQKQNLEDIDLRLWALNGEDAAKPVEFGRVVGQGIVAAVGDAIKDQRRQILPPRPNFDPRNDRALFNIDGAAYMQVLRDFVEAAKKERGKYRGHASTPHLTELGHQAEFRLALYDLGEQVGKVVKGFAKNPTHSLAQVEYLVQQFEKRCEEIRPGISQAESADSALRVLRSATTAEQLTEAHKMLHNDALNYFFGKGKQRSFVMEVRGAYMMDHKHVEQQKARMRGHFDNPLYSRNPFMAQVYDLRWAAAAERIRTYVRRCRGTLADPDFVVEKPGQFTGMLRLGVTPTGRGH